ncbi:MAG: hypothetical protein HY820_12715 [Acidobacteria bacterium]|nr:hypothetical protein [Acidobacteriota bacterium]
MSIELSAEVEARIEAVVRSGRFHSAQEVVEAAIRDFLGIGQAKGEFHRLREEIERAGVKMLTDEELREEVRERRGTWA